MRLHCPSQSFAALFLLSPEHLPALPHMKLYPMPEIRQLSNTHRQVVDGLQLLRFCRGCAGHSWINSRLPRCRPILEIQKLNGCCIPHLLSCTLRKLRCCVVETFWIQAVQAAPLKLRLSSQHARTRSLYSSFLSNPVPKILDF